MEHEDDVLQPGTAFKKASAFVRRNMYDLIVLLIVLVNIAQGFARISATGKTITEILGDGFITLVLSFTIARIFDIKGLDRGESDDSYLKATDAYTAAAVQCKPYAAYMDGWCRAYNARRRRELQENILLGAGIPYEAFVCPGFDSRGYTKEQQYYIRKARRVKFYELSTSELMSGLHDSAHEAEYDRATKTDYIRRSSVTDVASKVLLSVLLGYFGLVPVLELDWAALIWRAVQGVMFVALGVMKYYASYNYVTEIMGGKVVFKTNALNAFYNEQINQEKESKDNGSRRNGTVQTGEPAAERRAGSGGRDDTVVPGHDPAAVVGTVADRTAADFAAANRTADGVRAGVGAVTAGADGAKGDVG